MYNIALCDDKGTELDKMEAMLNSYQEKHEEYDVSQSMLSIACDTSSSLSNYHKEQQSKCQ